MLVAATGADHPQPQPGAVEDETRRHGLHRAAYPPLGDGEKCPAERRADGGQAVLLEDLTAQPALGVGRQQLVDPPAVLDEHRQPCGAAQPDHLGDAEEQALQVVNRGRPHPGGEEGQLPWHSPERRRSGAGQALTGRLVAEARFRPCRCTCCRACPEPFRPG